MHVSLGARCPHSPPVPATLLSVRSYTYDIGLTPVVTGISPLLGSTAGGTVVTLSGSNLGAALAAGKAVTVTIGSWPCTGVVAVSGGSQLQCTTCEYRSLLTAPPATAMYVCISSQCLLAQRVTPGLPKCPLRTTPAPAYHGH